MAVRRVFAVDLGASGGKCFAGIFEGRNFSMREIHRFSHEAVPFCLVDRRGRVTERTYWDDTYLFGQILAGLHAYRRSVARTLDSIGIDTWGTDGHFVIPDGDIAGRMYTYRDHRLDTMIAEVQRRVDPARMYEITGVHFQPFNLSNQLLWFRLHRADLFAPGNRYFPVPSLFHYYLGGGHVVDSSWASVTQLMDARKRTWSMEILRKLDIPPRVLPRIVRPGTAVGRLRARLAATVGLNRAALIAAASHDTACAFAAAPVEDPREALIISSGTWSLIGKLIPRPITTPEARRANMSNEGGVGNIRFLRNCMGTWIVQELRRVWRTRDGREMPWKEMDRIAQAAPAFAALIDPDDPGFYNPPNMQEAIANFCRRTSQKILTDRGAILRAVYESLALKYRIVNETLARITGTPSRVVHIVGGGCRNEMFNQFTADSVGVPVIAGPEEATAVGNIMVQALGLGILRSMKAALPLVRQAFPLRRYRPQNTARWDQACARFRTFVR